MTCIFFRLHTLIIRHARIFAAVGVATFCPLNHARAASVTQMFKEALKSYDSGNLRLATKLLYDIVKKYPTHEPSHLLLGRINYRQGQMVRAAFHFRKTSPDFLEGEAAYEYGITFFARGECKEAEAGLKRVGPGFRGANLAAFYRGICFSRNREWFRAELQLEKAINLPEHLIGVRRRLLTQVREAQQEERSRPIDTPPQSYSFQPVVVVPPPPADLALSEKEAKERRTPAKTAAKKDTTKPGLTISLAPNIVLGISSTDSDFNGAKRNRSDKNSITLGAELTLKQLFAPTKNGDQPSLSLPAKFSYKSDDIQGKTSVTKAYEDAIDQPFDVTTNDPKKSLRVLKASTTPEVSVPVFKAVDLIGKGQFELTNVQEEEVPSSQGYGGSGSAVITQGPISLTAFGEYMQFQITSRKEPNHTGFVRLKGSLSPAYNWTNGFFIEASGVFTNYEQFVPKPAGESAIEGVNGGINGTTFDGTSLEIGGSAGKKFEQAKIKLGAKQVTHTPSSDQRYLTGAGETLTFDGSLEFNFEVGASFTLNASSVQLTNYRAKVTKPKEDSTSATTLTFQDAPAPPEKVLAIGEGTQTNGKTGVKFTPIDGLSGSISLAGSRTELNAADQTLSDALNNETVTASTTVSLEITYNKTF